MEEYLKFKKDKPKNDKLIKKKFNKFITQKKEFGDDVWCVIKEFMINPLYEQSFRLQPQKELRYCESDCDPTTFLLGKRFGNLQQVKTLIYEEQRCCGELHNTDARNNKELKLYKVRVMEMRTRDVEAKQKKILLEFVDIIMEWRRDLIDRFGDAIDGVEDNPHIEYWITLGLCEWRTYPIYYMIGGDKHRYKLWNAMVSDDKQRQIMWKQIWNGERDVNDLETKCLELDYKPTDDTEIDGDFWGNGFWFG